MSKRLYAYTDPNGFDISRFILSLNTAYMMHIYRTVKNRLRRFGSMEEMIEMIRMNP